MAVTEQSLPGENISRRKRVWRENLEGWLFVAPFFIGFLVFTLRPFLTSIYYSFTRYDFFSPISWVGLQNYQSLLSDPRIYRWIGWTTAFAFFSVTLSMTIGLILALLANTEIKGIAILRTVYYLPSQLNPVAMAFVWGWLFNSQFGLLNYGLSLVGIRGPDWLNDSQWLLPATVIMMVFQAGGSMIINLSGLKGIPDTFYEAAQLDGANSRQMLFRITLPLLSPTIFFNLVMGIISALQSFTTLYLLLGARAPVYMVQLYLVAFDRLNIGYGSAMAWVLFLYILFWTFLVFRSSSFWVHYESARAR